MALFTTLALSLRSYALNNDDALFLFKLKKGVIIFKVNDIKVPHPKPSWWQSRDIQLLHVAKHLYTMPTYTRWSRHMCMFLIRLPKSLSTSDIAKIAHCASNHQVQFCPKMGVFCCFQFKSRDKVGVIWKRSISIWWSGLFRLRTLQWK